MMRLLQLISQDRSDDDRCIARLDDHLSERLPVAQHEEIMDSSAHCFAVRAEGTRIPLYSHMKSVMGPPWLPARLPTASLDHLAEEIGGRLARALARFLTHSKNKAE